MKSTSQRLSLATLFVATILFVGAGCGNTASNTNSTNSTNTTNVNSTNTSNANSSDDSRLAENANVTTGDTASTQKTFTIEASQFTFSPSTITVKKGDTVTLNLKSNDTTHGFSLPDFNISETLTPGKTVTVEFVADKAGTFSFACNVVCGAGHTEMTGSLVVEE
ncbi:MAG: cupredoxin domain-containing protein [Candidatus Kerfeldbacteria bacterium]|nr:cupredoxin domain-containing protein [Candidatus Kerfeldbacteria bacterium]